MNFKFLPAVSLFLLLFNACGQNTNSNKETELPTATTYQPAATPAVNLPKPYETKSAHNFSKVVGWEQNSTPVAPQGFTVTQFATGLHNPRWIYVLPNGDVLVAEAKKEDKGIKKVTSAIIGKDGAESDAEVKNRILLFRDTNNDGKPDLQKIFIDDLNLPFGMALVDNLLYVACTDAVWKFPYKEGETAITAKGQKILELPSEGRHWTRNIIANSDGSKLYIAVGSSSNVAENGIDKETRRACILEINPDGSGEKIYASGLRNPVGMDWRPGTNELWTAVNERDELGDNLVPDYLTRVHENGFYGWPYSYFGANKDPRIKDNEQRPELVKSAIVPDVDLGSHTASLGLLFYTGKMFPEKYRNGAFIGQHGSWNRSVPSGYKVVFVPFINNKPGVTEEFLGGFMIDPEKNEVHGRPVGVAMMKDGSLLVADDAGNSIWRVSYGK